MCDVTVVRTATNEPEAIYRAEAGSAQKAEQSAKSKAEQAINDAFSPGDEPRLAGEPRAHWRRQETTAKVQEASASLSPQEIMTYLSTSSCGDSLRREGRAAGFEMLSNDEHIAALAKLLAFVGIEKLTAFDNVLIRNQSDLPRYFLSVVSAGSKAGKAYWRASIPFLGELVLILEFGALVTSDVLTGIGWEGDIAKIVLGVAKDNRATVR